MKTAYASLLLLSALSIALPVQAQQMRIEMIPLNNRTADEMVSIIRPLVVNGGSVSSANNQLIVKSTSQNLEEIKQLLQSLDRPLRRLMITVRQDVDGFSERNRQSVSGNYSSGDISISNNVPAPRRGVEISGTDGDGNTIRYNHRNTRSNIQDSNDYRLQTVEGQAAYIDLGQSVPIPSQTAYRTGRGIIVQDSIEYYDATSGFYVEPRLNGNLVTLLISPYMSRVNPQDGGVFDVQNTETTVQGRLGEWIEIGGVNQQQRTEGGGVLYSTNRNNQETRSILVKVDEIH